MLMSANMGRIDRANHRTYRTSQTRAVIIESYFEYSDLIEATFASYQNGGVFQRSRAF